MGKCKYCGQDAGFLSHKHDECEQKHEKGVKETQELMFSFLCEPQANKDFSQKLQQLHMSSFVTEEEKSDCAVKAIDRFTSVIHRPFTLAHHAKCQAVPWFAEHSL